MAASTLLGLPLFGCDTTAAPVPENDEQAEIARLEAVARENPMHGFAYYQDEPEMKWYFELRHAAQKIYGKNREINGSLPEHISAHIDRAGDAGSHAMSAAEYREDTSAELNDRINEWQAELQKPPKKHCGKRVKRRTDDEDLEDEPCDEDENRRILGEWLDIALEERARRDRIPNFDHLADMELRAREKFGKHGLALIQLYVAESLAYENERWSEDTENLVNGKDLPRVDEAMDSLQQGDSGAASRFVEVLKRARKDQNAGYPPGVVVTFAGKRPRKEWTDDACRAAAEAALDGFTINGKTIDFDRYRIFEDEFPVQYVTTPEKTPEWWSAQFEAALNSADANVRHTVEAMNGARITDPVVMVFDNQAWHIADGKKRIASRFYARLSRVPAIWVVPQEPERRDVIAQQANLLEYEDEQFDDESFDEDDE